MDKQSLFDLPADLPRDDEFLELLAEGPSLRIERIISHGHTTADGQWYDQPQAEWVLLVQGEATLAFDDGSETDLGAGDAVFIEAHRRHRVTRTTVEPPCVWLAVHGEMSQNSSSRH
jgi:cupin 2 domain-containing protein